MLISDEYKFIFFHTPKTAGTSVTQALAPFCNIVANVKINPECKSPSYKKKGYTIHQTPTEFLARYPDQYRNYFKFAFVRNPWSRTVSFYKVKHQNMEFPAFVDRVAKEPMYQLPWLTGVDYVARFENLASELRYICQKVGIPWEKVKRKGRR